MQQDATRGNADGDVGSPGEQTIAPREPKGPEVIQAWVVSKVAEALHMKPGDIDVQLPFTAYGLESIFVFTLTGDLAEWLGIDLPATLLWDYPTIEALTRYLAEQSLAAP